MSRIRLVLTLYLGVLLLAPSAFAEVPESAPGRDSRIARLQAQVDAKILALDGIGEFAYRPVWFWEEGVTVAPCAPASPSFLDAERELSTVDSLVTGATSKTPLETLRNQLERLASLPCLATAAGLPSFYSVESLQAYWSKGGRLAFTTALNVATGHSYVVPADPRRSTAELASEHPRLAPFVCKVPASCARETRWKDELEAELQLSRLQGLLKGLESASSDWQASEKRCALAAATAPRDLQFVHWRDCVERIPRTEQLLPRGNLHAAQTGWLLLHVEAPKAGVSGHLAVNLATGGALRIPAGFGCGLTLSDPPDGEPSFCHPGYDAPVRLQLSVQGTQRLAWQLLMQAATSTGRSQSRIARMPSEIAATGVVFPPVGTCGGAGRPETAIGWALADRSGALIATGEDSSWRHSFLDRTQLLYEALLTKASAPEALRKGQWRWWPKTSQLLRKPWGDFANPDLFDVLNELEAW